jgi:hypothetical protein
MRQGEAMIITEEYIESTARLYASNVQKARRNGFLPIDWAELSYEYHMNRLWAELGKYVA